MSLAKSVAGLLVVVAAVPFAAGGGKEAAKVKFAVSAGPVAASGLQTVTVNLEIDKGWHIYANPIKNQDFAEAQTTIKVRSNDKLAGVKVLYPEGKLYTDKKTKLTFQVYEDRVAIPVQVQRTVGSVAPLEVEVFFMVCDENTCRPTKKIVSVP